MNIKRSALWLLLTPVISLAAYAQDEPIVLPTVVVTERKSESETITPSPDTVRKSLKTTPGGTNFIEPAKHLGSKHTLRDFLDYQPGITLLDFFGGTDHPVLTIRGSGIQSHPLSRGVMLLENDLPFNEADGSFIIGMLETRDTGFVAVKRGANATNPASDSLGGELNFYNLTGREETGKVSAQYGSFGTAVGRAALGKAYDSGDFHISASGSRSDGFRDHSDQKRYTVRANMGFVFKNFENRTWVSYTDQKFDIPGPLTLDTVYDNPSENTNDVPPMVSTTDPHRETSQWRIANRSMIQTGRFNHDLGFYVQQMDDLFVSPTTTKDNEVTTYGAQYKLETAHQNVLNYGVAFSFSQSSMDLYYSKNKNNPLPPIQTFRDARYDATARHISAQFHSQWQLIKNWQLSGLLRWVDTKRDIDSKDDNVSYNHDWDWLAPKVGLVWTPSQNHAFFANISTTREAPIVGDMIQFKPPPPPPAHMAVAELEPQKSVSYEIGARGDLADILSWDIVLYRSDIRKELLDYSPDGVNTYSYNYDGKTRHQGIELGLTSGWKLPSSYGRLDGRLSYTHNDFKFRDNVFRGNQIAGVPRDMISAQISYLYSAWRFDINSRTAIGRTYTDHGNQMSYGGYTIWGTRLYYELNKRISFFVQGDNLTDKKYVSSTNTPAVATATGVNYFPGSGRSVSAGLDIVF
ncbi:MAG: TonB-dependent receptor [Burkholderiales bacterium]|jgi:iron complex outermembrane receptor protein|nr:TonB-dependent receptor [Burkholderiales bacterium]